MVMNCIRNHWKEYAAKRGKVENSMKWLLIPEQISLIPSNQMSFSLTSVGGVLVVEAICLPKDFGKM